jgi:hypothetical protein
MPVSSQVKRSDNASDNLSRFRWHTGTEPRPVGSDEELPVLFRDIGPVAMSQFLRGSLKRLAGPVTPITYLRTADYQEPYTDYARIGRIALLRPQDFRPWHSGIRHIFIALAARMPDQECLGFIPGHVPLHAAAQILATAQNRWQMREAFGGREYDEVCAETISGLDRLNVECEAAERLALPLRIRFQTGTLEAKRRLRDELCEAGLDEQDFCAAWHHLPPGKRELIQETLPGLLPRFKP